MAISGVVAISGVAMNEFAPTVLTPKLKLTAAATANDTTIFR